MIFKLPKSSRNAVRDIHTFYKGSSSVYNSPQAVLLIGTLGTSRRLLIVPFQAYLGRSFANRSSFTKRSFPTTIPTRRTLQESYDSQISPDNSDKASPTSLYRACEFADTPSQLRHCLRPTLLADSDCQILNPFSIPRGGGTGLLNSQKGAFSPSC